MKYCLEGILTQIGTIGNVLHMVFVNNIALPLASLDCKMWEIGKDIYSVCQSPQATFTTPKLAYGVVKLAYGDGVSATCH